MPGTERRAPYEGRRPVGVVWLECTGWGLLSLILSPPPPTCVMPNHFNRIHREREREREYQFMSRALGLEGGDVSASPTPGGGGGGHLPFQSSANSVVN